MVSFTLVSIIPIIANNWQVNTSTVNRFGEQIKLLREQKGLLQRQVAIQLDIDIPMLSKIERGERNAKREQVATLSNFFEVSENQLISLWLADKVFEVVKDEPAALKALEVTENEVKRLKKNNK